MPRSEHVQVLLHKAEQDEQALDILLRDAGAPLEVAGFLAQQAAERMLKAALKAAGVDYPFTHVIDHLIYLVEQAGMDLPQELGALSALTPFAADLRYEPLSNGDAAALDVAHARRLLRRLRAWVEDLVEAGDGGDDAQ